MRRRRVAKGCNRVVGMITSLCNKAAALAGWVVVFCEQFCGVNVIAFYSPDIFLASGFMQVSTLTSSLGLGALNWSPSLPLFSPSVVLSTAGVSANIESRRNFWEKELLRFTA